MKELDKGTFGNSPAAIKLVEILNENNIRPTRVANILNSFDKILADISHVNVTSAIKIVTMLYKEYSKKCEFLESPLDTFTHNVLNTKYKMWLKKKNAQMPHKNRPDGQR
jgi:hypothetical protein